MRHCRVLINGALGTAVAGRHCCGFMSGTLWTAVAVRHCRVFINGALGTAVAVALGRGVMDCGVASRREFWVPACAGGAAAFSGTVCYGRGSLSPGKGRWGEAGRDMVGWPDGGI